MPAVAQWLKNMGHKASHVKMLRPLYDAQLGTLNIPLVCESFPADLWGGDAGRGRWLASGQVDIDGHRVPLDAETWFVGTEIQHSPHFEKLHSFAFLMELKTLGGDAGRRTARLVTERWLADFDRYHHVIWDPALTARRLVNWLRAYPFCFEQADEIFIRSLHNGFYRQHRHLVYSLNHDTELSSYERVDILWALAIIQCHIPALAQTENIENCLSGLKHAVADIAYEDGGLTDRNPETLMEFTQQLIDLRHSLTQAGHALPVWLTKRIETGARALNALIHTDKALACFQGGTAADKSMLEKILRLSNIRIRKGDLSLCDFGYTSLRKSRTSVIIDHGHDTGDTMHLSPFAFELCHGAHRLIINCGTHKADEEWQKSLSAAAAHSALTIEGKDPDPVGLRNIKTQHETMNGAALFSGTHTGFKAGFGVTCTRRIYLDPHGEDCRGEDLLIRIGDQTPLTAILRFHLHPLVKASPIRNGGAVLLRLPSGGGWVFQADNARLRLEPGIYTGEDGLSIRKTVQIVLASEMRDVNHQIKWAIRTTSER